MFECSPEFIAGMLMADIYKSKTISIKNGTAIFICFILSTFHRMIYAKMGMNIYQETFSKPIIAAVMLYMRYLGIMTYPLYLLHQRIGYIIFDNLMGHYNKYLILVGTISLMITASFIIVKYISARLSNYFEKYPGLLIDFFLDIRTKPGSIETDKVNNIQNSMSDN